MTPLLDRHSIVVAADGSDDATRALHWAADQAWLERRPLVVVTAVGATGVPAIAWSGMGAAYAWHPDEMLKSAQAVADDGLAQVRQRQPGLQASAIALHGDPRQVLVDLSREVHLMVLGSRGRGVFRSKLLGSVSAAVSRDAACPVVVCRPRPDGVAATAGVLVGADATVESLPVIERAFAQASLTGQRLTVMHCFWDETAIEEHQVALSQNVAGFCSTFPEVEVDLRLAHGLAEECLSADSDQWDLIVVGRHPVDTVLRFITASVATMVVERARTSVFVVPQADPPADPDAL